MKSLSNKNDSAASSQVGAMTSLSTPTPTRPAQEGISLDWASLLDEHRRWLATVVRSRLANPSAIEEVLQEVALAVLKQSSRPVDKDKVPAFLYRIAVRKVVNHHRVHGRQKRLLHGFARQQANDAGLDTNCPGSWLLREEQSQSFQAALKTLNSKDRELLMLKYTEGWGYRELSDHLGVSIKTIEYRLLRARQALRDALSREGDLP